MLIFMRTYIKKLVLAVFSYLFLANVALAGSFYDISVLESGNRSVSLSKYKNQVVMVVNVASRCGYTSQYSDLQKLYEKYQNKGFIILGFPSNEFGQQEPGSDQEIQKFCKLNYGVTFPVMAKTTVNGANASELYKWLTSQKKLSGPITWNFNKFLINKKGQLVQRFESSVTPQETEKTIESLLK